MKFADFFPTMLTPVQFTVDDVKFNVQTQYGPTHILTMNSGTDAADWFIKPDKFNDMFPHVEVTKGMKIAVMKNPSTTPGRNGFYTVVSTDGGAVLTEPRSVVQKPTFTGRKIVAKPDYETEREKTGYRAGLAGVWQALVSSGVSPENAFSAAPEHARRLRKMADEMYYSDLAAGEAVES